MIFVPFQLYMKNAKLHFSSFFVMKSSFAHIYPVISKYETQTQTQAISKVVYIECPPSSRETLDTLYNHSFKNIQQYAKYETMYSSIYFICICKVCKK